MDATVTAIDTTVELPAPTNLLNPPRFSPVVVTPEIVTLSEKHSGSATVNPSRVVAPSTSDVVEILNAPVTSSVVLSASPLTLPVPFLKSKSVNLFASPNHHETIPAFLLCKIQIVYQCCNTCYICHHTNIVPSCIVSNEIKSSV